MKNLCTDLASTSRPSRSPRPVLTARRGFTLVELIVALAVGLSVSVAAFLLAKNSTRVFQEEARITGAQLAVTLGMNRMIADIQRAGFLSSPNMQPTVPQLDNNVQPPIPAAAYAAPNNRDPHYCGDKTQWPEGLKRLASLTIETRDLTDGTLTQSEDNGFHPERITLGGSFNTVEQFPATEIKDGVGGGKDIFLDVNSGAMVRTVSAEEEGSSKLAEIFREGRFLRIVDYAKGSHQYGVITGLVTTGTPLATVQIRLAPFPAIETSQTKQTCGYNGMGGLGQLFVNPVSRIRYDLRSLKGHPSYGGLVQEVTPELSGDDGRTELIRVELNENDEEVAGTLELVAEYAVDLRFGITVKTKEPVPQLLTFPIQEPADPAVTDRADLPGGALAQPETVRAVQVRLVTRARTPDRQTDLGSFEDAGDGRRYRFRIGTVKSEIKYARLRTHYAEVALQNQAGVLW